jgi:hypothetical protein
MEIVGETIKRASKNLSETVLGPTALIVLVMLVTSMKEK